MLQHGARFVRHVVPEVVRPIHSLWNQIIGFFFILLAISPLPGALRDSSNTSRLVLTIPFCLLMFYFGVSSFVKARRISKRISTTRRS